MSEIKYVYYKLLIQNNDFTSRTEYIDQRNITVGRSKTNKTLLKGKSISRKHAKIKLSKKSEKFYVRCLSKNGLFVNGEFYSRSSSPAILVSSSLIQIGDVFITFLLPSTKQKYHVDYDLLLESGKILDPFVNLKPIYYEPKEVNSNENSRNEMIDDSTVKYSEIVKSSPCLREKVTIYSFEKIEKPLLNSFLQEGLGKFISLFLKKGLAPFGEVDQELKRIHPIFEIENVAYMMGITLLTIMCQSRYLKKDFETCRWISFIIRNETQNSSIQATSEMKEIIKSSINPLDFSGKKLLSLYVCKTCVNNVSLEEIDKIGFRKPENIKWESRDDTLLLAKVAEHGTDSFDLIKSNSTSVNHKAVDPNFLEERFYDLTKFIRIEHRHLLHPRQNSDAWSLREHLEFIQVVRSLGVPENWGNIKKYFPKFLRLKSDQQIKQRYEKLFECINLAMDSRPGYLICKPNCFNLTQKGAKNLSSRIDHLKSLRACYKIMGKQRLGELISKLNKTDPAFAKMPQWWYDEECDIELFISFVTYGLSNWETILKKDEYRYTSLPGFKTVLPLLYKRFCFLVHLVQKLR